MASVAAATCPTMKGILRHKSTPQMAIRPSAWIKQRRQATASRRQQRQWLLPPPAAAASSGGSAEEVEYKDSLTDLMFIALCRVAYGRLAGWQSPRRWGVVLNS